MEMENTENIKENVGRGDEPACYVMVNFLRQLPNIFCEDNLVIRYLTKLRLVHILQNPSLTLIILITIENLRTRGNKNAIYIHVCSIFVK